MMPVPGTTAAANLHHLLLLGSSARNVTAGAFGKMKKYFEVIL
jgi:hypothetical protein